MNEHATVSDLRRRLADAETALRRQAEIEAALQRSEQLRSIAIEGGRMGTWRWNRRDEVIYGDAAFLSLWGCPPSDEPHRLSEFTDRMSPQGQAEMGEMVTRAIEAGEVFDGQVAVVSGPTSGRWVRWRGCAERERPWIVNGVSFDVTDQREQDERLRESDTRHRLLIDSWARAVWETDAWGLVTADSPSWRACTGQSLDEWLGYGWLNAIHPDDRAYAERQWREAIPARGLVDAEFRLQDPGNGWRWTNVRAAPVLNAAGEIVKWAGMNIDIHARKSAEEALATSEQRLSLATAASELGIWEWDLVNDRPVGNLFYYHHFDLEPYAEHCGVDVIAKLHPDDIPMMLAVHKAAMDPGSDGHYTVEYRVLREGAGPRWLSSHGQVYFKGEGAERKPERSLGTSLDITEQKLAEAALRQSEEGQAFLLKLSDALRPLVDPVDIEDAATRVLGEHLHANRVAYVEVTDEEYIIERDYVNGVPSMAGRHPVRSFGSSKVVDYSDGKTVVVNDIASDLHDDTSAAASFAAINIAAGIGVPLMKKGRFVANLVVHSSEPRNWTPQEVRIAEETAERTWAAVERARAETKRRESEERLRTLMEGIPQLVWRSCDEGRWTWASPQWLEFTGQRQEETHDLGRLNAVHPDDREATLLAWEVARPHGMLDVEYRVRRGADGAWLWHHTRSLPVRDSGGSIVEWLGTSTDVHGLRELQARQEVLVAELQHRTRNLITVVRSLSDRTVGNAASLDDFKRRFGRRLAALSRVQGLLSHLSAGERVDFDDLLRSELTALGVTDHKVERVTLDGPADVPLRSATVQTLALAIHELATNAVKYGALVADGANARLSVQWHVEPATADDPPILHVEWRESGVIMPHISTPAPRRGYGRELIERALPYQLGAITTYELGADGVRCTIEMPISWEGSHKE